MRSADMTPSAPSWAKNVLYAAAIYNLAWGVAVICAPLVLFRWADMSEPRYPQIWQCVGMIVGVYGIGYWLAARDPYRHWPIVLVGLLGKVFGPVGFLNAAFTGALPWKWGATIVTNDLIWWMPFGSILYLAFRNNTNSSRYSSEIGFAEALRSARSHRNATLLELSNATPTLVVFLRHAGCTFCREMLAKLKEVADDIDQTGASLAIVHMGAPMDGTLMVQKYRLHNAHLFSDPQCALYRAFGLRRGQLPQLFSPHILIRGCRAMLQGHGLGTLAGDGFRMPGAFILVEGRVLTEHRSRTVADHPDYLALLAAADIKQESPQQRRNVRPVSERELSRT